MRARIRETWIVPLLAVPLVRIAQSPSPNALNLQVLAREAGAVLRTGNSRVPGASATRPSPKWYHWSRRVVIPLRVPKQQRPVPAAEWSDPRHRRGLWGEQVAMEHLARRGWTIEAHRFRLGHSDVDLVIRRGSLVAFVEVKTRGSEGWGTPAESIDWRKRRTIARVAEVWCERHGRRDDVYRFDVVEVRVRSRAPAEIDHLEDAWRLG